MKSSHIHRTKYEQILNKLCDQSQNISGTNFFVSKNLAHVRFREATTYSNSKSHMHDPFAIPTGILVYHYPKKEDLCKNSFF